LNKSVSQETPVSADAVNISDNKSVGPAALPSLVFAIAARTSSSEMKKLDEEIVAYPNSIETAI